MMKESIRQFAHEIFESDLIDKINAINVNEDHILIQPATREMYCDVRRMVTRVGRGLELAREDFHTLRIKEHIPHVTLELTQQDLGYLCDRLTMEAGTGPDDLRGKLFDLYSNFEKYAE